MTTAKHEVSIGLQHENCYLVGVMKLGSFQVFFPCGGGGKSNFQLEEAQCASGYQPPSKTQPHLSCLTPLNWQTIPAPLFRQPLLLFWFFVNPSPPKFQAKSWIFQQTPSFSSLTPSYLLKVPKFIVKVCRFEFLLMTEKNIFVLNFFCH